MAAVESRRHLGHESLHLLADHGLRLPAVVQSLRNREDLSISQTQTTPRRRLKVKLVSFILERDYPLDVRGHVGYMGSISEGGTYERRQAGEFHHLGRRDSGRGDTSRPLQQVLRHFNSIWDKDHFRRGIFRGWRTSAPVAVRGSPFSRQHTGALSVARAHCAKHANCSCERREVNPRWLTGLHMTRRDCMQPLPQQEVVATLGQSLLQPAPSPANERHSTVVGRRA